MLFIPETENAEKGHIKQANSENLCPPPLLFII